MRFLCELTSSLRSLRSLLSIVISVALKASFQRQKWQSPVPSGRLDAYKRKKHSDVLCFLVAGPRIELGTSWLWIMRSNQLSYPAINVLELCWDRRTRTLTDRARICSATITPYLNLASLWFWDCKGTYVLQKSKNILQNLLKIWSFPLKWLNIDQIKDRNRWVSLHIFNF